MLSRSGFDSAKFRILIEVKVVNIEKIYCQRDYYVNRFEER